jgi:hypothetical protein
MIVYEHTFPAWAIVTALVTALLLGWFAAWRCLHRNLGNAIIVTLYSVILAGLGWCLLLPGLTSGVTQLLKPRFLIAVDTSRSMTLSPSANVPSRWTTAQEALKLPWIRSLTSECEIEIFPFSSQLGESIPAGKAAELKPEGTNSGVSDALRQIAERHAGLKVAGLLLLSDGVDTREALDDWAAAKRPFPIYTLRLEPPGGWQQEPDTRIDSVSAARRVTIGWKTEIKVKVSGQGTRGQPVMVQLFQNGQLFAEKPTQIPDDGGERELVFEAEHAKVGVYQYRVFVPPLTGEKNKEDNEYQLSIEAIDARNRLLYVEGVPRWEYKFLRRMLLSEQQVSPIIFFTGADGKPVGGTPVGNVTPEITPQQLAYFKVVMLGNLDAKEIGEQRANNLVKFVEDGGSLVILGGPKAWATSGLLGTSLAKVLPVRGASLKLVETEKPFPVKLTEAARGHSAFAGDAALWEIIPPVLSVFTGAELTPGAQSLVTAETAGGAQPMVVAHRFGQGKVTAILTDSMWRWQLGPEAGRAKPYERFWAQLISWLLPREEEIQELRLELSASRDQVFFGESVDLLARIAGDENAKPESVDTRITLPDGRTISYRMSPQQVTTPSGKVFPGYGYAFQPESAGSHKVVGTAKVKGAEIVSEPLTLFVRPYSPETVPRPIKADLLQALAAANGGKFFESLDALNSGLNELKVEATEEKLSEYRTLWREWPVLVGLMTMLTATWALRKMRNMP